MAEAMRNAMTPDDDAASGDSHDDFELISDNSLVDEAKNFSLVSNEYGSREYDGEAMAESKGPVRVIDPLEAFEMIQSEHRLLKDELSSQNQLLRQRLSAFEEGERLKTEEVASLKKRVQELSEELTDAKTHQGELERQLKYFKECSEQADLLAAKLMEAEDVAKAHNALIQQLQEGACGVVTETAPALTTDQTLAGELAKKDELIKKMEGTLSNLESALGTVHSERTKAREEADRLERMNKELRDLIAALQNQAEMDKAEWAAIRLDLEQQIEMLSDRIVAFQHEFSNRSFAEDHAASPSARYMDSEQQHSDSHWAHCPRCHLPMANAGPHPCPSIIDGLD